MCSGAQSRRHSSQTRRAGSLDSNTSSPPGAQGLVNAGQRGHPRSLHPRRGNGPRRRRVSTGRSRWRPPPDRHRSPGGLAQRASGRRHPCRTRCRGSARVELLHYGDVGVEVGSVTFEQVVQRCEPRITELRSGISEAYRPTRPGQPPRRGLAVVRTPRDERDPDVNRRTVVGWNDELLVDSIDHYGNRRQRVGRLASAWNQASDGAIGSVSETGDPLILASAEPRRRARTTADGGASGC